MGILFFSESNAQAEGSTLDTESTGNNKNYVIEISDTTKNRSSIFRKGESVCIKSVNKKGKYFEVKAKIIAITNNDMTFMPISNRYDKVTYTVNNLSFIGFKTAGTRALGTIGSILSFPNIESNIKGIYLNDQPKDSPCLKDRSKDSPWKIKIIEENNPGNKK